jgi:hypothetical protein
MSQPDETPFNSEPDPAPVDTFLEDLREMPTAKLRRDAGLLAAANALAAHPDQMAAFIAGLGLPADAGSSPVSRCGEPSITAGAVGTADGPGLA